MPISHAEGVDGGDFGGDFVDEDGVDAEAGAGGQRFAGDFEEDSLVHVRISIAWGVEGAGRGAGRDQYRGTSLCSG